MSSAKRLDLTAVYFTVFREGDRRSPSCVYSILEMMVATIPLNDAASNDDSNGGHIVFWSNLDLCCEIRALGGVDFDRVGQKVRPFLTETIKLEVVQSG